MKANDYADRSSPNPLNSTNGRNTSNPSAAEQYLKVSYNPFTPLQSQYSLSWSGEYQYNMLTIYLML